MSLGNTRAQLERQTLVALLEEHRWHLTNAARAAGISTTWLRSRMAAYAIERPQPPAPSPVVSRRTTWGPRSFRRIAPRTWVPVST